MDIINLGIIGLSYKSSKMDMGAVMSRYDRLLVSFYIVCGLSFLSVAGSFYFLKVTQDKFAYLQTALDTATFEFKTCKKLYKRGLTFPSR